MFYLFFEVDHHNKPQASIALSAPPSFLPLRDSFYPTSVENRADSDLQIFLQQSSCLIHEMCALHQHVNEWALINVVAQTITISTW